MAKSVSCRDDFENEENKNIVIGDDSDSTILKNNIKIHDGKISKKDTKCGIGCFYPKWLQIFASKKTFVVVYALAGMQHFIISSYGIGTMSTIEKSFKMSSRKSGLISGAWDIGSLFANIGVTYVAAKGHRTRWVAFGMLLVGISSFLRVIPYLIFGPGENIKMYTKEYGYLYNGNDMEYLNEASVKAKTYTKERTHFIYQCFKDHTQFLDTSIGNVTILKKQSTNINCGIGNDNTNILSFYIFFFSQIILGIGTAVYWTCGATYLDDNVRKNIVPALLAIVQVIRLFGPTIGFLMSSYALKLYVDPYLTPNINNEDPRWIGAWWIGWYPVGVICLILTVLLFLFPRTLPRAAARKQNIVVAEARTPLSISDFKKSMVRILKNKIMIFNSFSSVCFTMGLMAYWTFMPKYMESQFRLSASKSNFLTGTVGILSNALGIMTAGLIISKLRPSPRFLAGWNVVVEMLDVIGHASYSFMSCDEQTYHGHWNNDHSWNLTETCNAHLGCGNDIQHAPVCDVSRELAFYSSCHAGCNTSTIINGTLEYGGCSCVPGSGKVIDGLCFTDCSLNVIIYIFVMGILSFTSATGRTANTLIQFRCVNEEDKSLSIGVTESLLSFMAFIPSPIFYGIIMDWACIVWGDNCGETGNCWIYDGFKLRFAFNFTASAFLLAGTLLDCFVWYYAKDLKIYDDDFEETTTNMNKRSKLSIVKNKDADKKDIVIPLITLPSTEER
ncbi:hypothetical protein PGB90_005966 [Kerria lacca]